MPLELDLRDKKEAGFLLGMIWGLAGVVIWDTTTVSLETYPLWGVIFMPVYIAWKAYNMFLLKLLLMGGAASIAYSNSFLYILVVLTGGLIGATVGYILQETRK